MRNLAAVFKREFLRVFEVLPAFAVLIGAVVLYAALYPQPYVNEALRNVPIAVVDRDRTVSSREFSRRIDATESVAIAIATPDFSSAERMVFARQIHGVLLIPEHFERDLLHGRPSPVALYADASYFLIYQRVAGAVTSVARAFGAEVEAKRLITAGVDAALASAASDPMPFTAVPIFNPQGGYATYVLPAAFILILQQTLLIGVGLLGTLPGGAPPASDRSQPSAVTVVLGKLLAYVALEAVTVPFYLIVLPYLYGVPRLGSPMMILFFALPFVLAVCGLGLVVAAALRKPLYVQLATAAVGLPLFFLAGFAWPTEAMPAAAQAIATLIPSTMAIDGLVRIGQFGAPLHEVRGSFLALWALSAFYVSIAIAIEMYRRSRQRPDIAAPRPMEDDAAESGQYA